MTAFNPFIPLNDKDSSIPEEENPLENTVKYTISLSVNNPRTPGLSINRR